MAAGTERQACAISLAEANKIIDGPSPAEKRQVYALGCHRADAGGRAAFQKQDGASLMVRDRLRQAPFWRASRSPLVAQVLQKAKEKPAFMQSLSELSDGPLFLEAGGQLIRDASGEVVGALGVTGDVNEVDDLCAIDGIHAGGFRADADFDAEAAKRLNKVVRRGTCASVSVRPEVRIKGGTPVCELESKDNSNLSAGGF